MSNTAEATPAARAVLVPPAGFIARADLPTIGTRIGDDAFVGITKSAIGDIALFVNLALHESADWEKAQALAADLSSTDHPAGTYSLPTRKEQALLFANAAEHFEERWYWSSEQSSAGYAWIQGFGLGLQHDARKALAYRVRAVRRLVIQ